MNTLPPLFLSHGSPMIALEPREAGRFMQALGPAIDAAFGRPRAILAVSAHSLTREPVLLAAPRHEADLRLRRLRPAAVQMRYDAPGAPALARAWPRCCRPPASPAHGSDEGGLDHGIWTPLRYLYPAADVPVLPLAWPPNWTPARLFALGQALAPLADEGVLILGSGSITHNLRRVFAGGLRPDAEAPATPESTAFRDWFAQQAPRATGRPCSTTALAPRTPC